jgi:hypothetical protein
MLRYIFGACPRRLDRAARPIEPVQTDALECRPNSTAASRDGLPKHPATRLIARSSCRASNNGSKTGWIPIRRDNQEGVRRLRSLLIGSYSHTHDTLPSTEAGHLSRRAQLVPIRNPRGRDLPAGVRLACDSVRAGSDWYWTGNMSRIACRPRCS